MARKRGRMSMRHIIAILTVIMCNIALLVSCSKTVKTMSATEILNLGEKYLLELDYEQAVVLFTKLIEVEPKNFRGYTGLAEAYAGLGNTGKAVTALENGLGQLPDNESIKSMLNELTSWKLPIIEETDVPNKQESENALISNIEWDIQSANPNLRWNVPYDNSMIESYQVYYKPYDSPENAGWIKSPHNEYWRPINGYTHGGISISGLAGASHIDGFLSGGKYIFKVVAITTAESGIAGFEAICPVPITITRTAVPITIDNLVYDASLRQLEVHGKFPEDAQMLYIQLYDGEQNSYNGWIKEATADKGIVEIREGTSESDIVGKRLIIVYATGSGTPDEPRVNIAPSIDSDEITVIKK